MEYLADPIRFAIVCGLLGLFVGSFLNVVILRLPVMMERAWLREAAELRGEEPAPAEPFNLAVPRSRCPHCGHPIGALENVPILSYVLLRGRCRHCGAAIGLRYPIVELATALLSAAIAAHFGPGWAGASALVFGWTMIALTVIDLDTQLLPDSLTLPLLWLGLLVNLGGAHTDLESAVVGAAAGYLVLWSIYWAFRLATGREGMGYGDFKLLAAIGAWLGWQMLPLTILLSSVVGAATGIAMIVAGRHARETPIPFGPYLAAAGLLSLFWGPAITTMWLGGS